jgi:membrane-associated protease RseP (regulator of RpoE activity)
MRVSKALGWIASLLSLAVLLTGLGLVRAAADDEPKKQEKKAEPKKEQPKQEKIRKELPTPGFGDIEDFIGQLPEGTNAEQLRRMMEMMRQQFPGGRFAGGPFGGFNPGREGRLGARVATPSATLADQLDLPKGQGLVVEDVQNDSAAAKAGIKNNDILLELNGKAVPSNPRDFVKQLEDVKANTAVDAVVLRKGKRETIKGLSLPEAKVANEPPTPFKGFGGAGAGGFGGPPAGFPRIGAGEGALIDGPGAAGAGARRGVFTSVFRTDNRFTTRHEEGTLVITVTGTIADGKAQVSSILVRDGAEHKYESMDKVPEQYRDKVKNLIDLSERSGGKVEIKETKIK